MFGFIEVPYHSHPAFCELVPKDSKSVELDRKIFEVIQKINLSLAQLSKEDFDPDHVPKQVQKYFDLNILTLHAELEGLVQSYCEKAPLVTKQCVQMAMEKTFHVLKDEAIFIQRKQISQKKNQTSLNHPVVQDLEKEGISFAKMQTGAKDAINDSLATWMVSFKQECLSSLQDRHSKSLPLEGRHMDLLMKQMKDAGFLEAADLFQGHKMEPVYCALAYAQDQENWYQNAYQDIHLETQKCAYMHYDNDHALLKVIFYLSDVEMEQGPFSFVKGTHQRGNEHYRYFLHKAMDDAFEMHVKPKAKEGDLYYRKWLKYPEYRRYFAALPQAFRGSSHFGDDVLDDSDLAKNLLKDESFVFSKYSDMFIFFGGRLVHRGGLVKKSHRWALQVGLLNAPTGLELAIRESKKITRKVMEKSLGKQGFQTLKSILRGK